MDFDSVEMFIVAQVYNEITQAIIISSVGRPYHTFRDINKNFEIEFHDDEYDYKDQHNSLRNLNTNKLLTRLNDFTQSETFTSNTNYTNNDLKKPNFQEEEEAMGVSESELEAMGIIPDPLD